MQMALIVSVVTNEVAEVIAAADLRSNRIRDIVWGELPIDVPKPQLFRQTRRSDSQPHGPVC